MAGAGGLTGCPILLKFTLASFVFVRLSTNVGRACRGGGAVSLA